MGIVRKGSPKKGIVKRTFTTEEGYVNINLVSLVAMKVVKRERNVTTVVTYRKKYPNYLPRIVK